MRNTIIAVCLVWFSGARLHAQAVPLPKRIPIDSSAITRPSTGTMHMGQGTGIGPWTGVTWIVDGVVAWPVRGTKAERADVTAEHMLGKTIAEDMAEIEVDKGPDAMERGACPGTALIIMKTKGGHWRPPSSMKSSATKPDCSRLAR